MAKPLKQMVAPANGCMYFSNTFIGKKLIPYKDSTTIVIMVAMVQKENREDTITIPPIFAVTAGYINNGIRLLRTI